MSWPGTQDAAFYAITVGTAFLAVEGEQARQFRPGDLVLLPTGVPHALASAPRYTRSAEPFTANGIYPRPDTAVHPAIINVLSVGAAWVNVLLAPHHAGH